MRAGTTLFCYDDLHEGLRKLNSLLFMRNQDHGKGFLTADETLWVMKMLGEYERTRGESLENEIESLKDKIVELEEFKSNVLSE